jgi:hypothetical protein
MQEAMLACIDITKPKFKISAAKLATRKFPLIWLCKMANSVLGKQGELLEYHQLIANLKTRATWTHSYGNKLGRLTQGMPGQVTGMDTIFFIPKTRSREQGQRMSHTASSPASSGQRKPMSQTKQDW